MSPLAWPPDPLPPRGTCYLAPDPLGAFGITAAIHSGEDDARTQAWAAAFAAAGFDGVRYLVSHDPAQRSIGFTLFGSADPAGWPVLSTDPINVDLIAAARRRFGIRVLPTP